MPNKVKTILASWPSRTALHEDVARYYPNLNVVAVHRWFSRGSIPGRYWQAIVEGAKARKLPVSTDKLAEAHSCVSPSDAPAQEAEG